MRRNRCERNCQNGCIFGSTKNCKQPKLWVYKNTKNLQINESNLLKEIGVDIGAIIVDSCSTDLRSVADLYELLSGTNIQKSDLIAIIRDDSTFMPNTEQIIRQLNLPVVNTFFTTRSAVGYSFKEEVVLRTFEKNNYFYQKVVSRCKHLELCHQCFSQFNQLYQHFVITRVLVLTLFLMKNIQSKFVTLYILLKKVICVSDP